MGNFETSVPDNPELHESDATDISLEDSHLPLDPSQIANPTAEIRAALAKRISDTRYSENGANSYAKRAAEIEFLDSLTNLA